MIIPESVNRVFNRATCLFPSEEVELAFDRMAEEINSELGEKNPILLCVLIGGLVPTGHLLPRLNFPMELDYIHVTRYQGKMSGSILNWKAKPSALLDGRTVLVIDDILDAGLTLAAVMNYCRNEGAREVYSAVLVDKINSRDEGGIIEADFTGLRVEDRYVFGYGMDYHNYLRNAPGIYLVADEDL